MTQTSGEREPVLVDTGVGTASDARVAMAMEFGCEGDGLINTAIAETDNSVAMTRAMKLAVVSGCSAYLPGSIEGNALLRPVAAAGWIDLADVNGLEGSHREMFVHFQFEHLSQHLTNPTAFSIWTRLGNTGMLYKVFLDRVGFVFV